MILTRPQRTHAAILLALASSLVTSHAHESARLDLREHWALRSSAEVAIAPEVLSTTAFTAEHWRQIRVPATVLAAQVAAGEFKDIFHADNLRRLPGMTVGAAGTKTSPYATSWWYRTEFRLPPEFAGRNVWLHFNGINTKANVWLNGRRLADSLQVAGAFRLFELNATGLVARDGVNVLAVEVFPPTNDDFGINLVDWVPTPPDQNMGLWREVYLTASGPVRLRHPAVFTHFPDASLARADLTVRAELHNDTASHVEGTLHARFDGVSLAQRVSLAPGESRPVQFTPADHPQLRVAHPDVWWPAGWGEQKLHELAMEFDIAGTVSDAQTAMFGIRETTAELHGDAPRPGEVFNNNGEFTGIKTDERPLLLRVNHRPILIRGGGWCPDMLMRSSPERIAAEFRYLLDMHLNAIRLEGKLESDAFFDLADRMGILILAGWCCGDRWEHWSEWKPNDYTIAYESLRTQILRLRHHASVALWMNGSDNHPPADVETAYRQILAETGWPNPSISSATSVPTTVSGPTGVKMTGPYDYVPPGYWLLDRNHFGGAFGFNTETSPGAAIPDLGSLRKFLPPEKIWPVNELWNLHAGAGDLNNNITHFRESMDAIYGPPAGLDDFLRKSQAMCYDGQRAMFEAYARNKYRSTGVIQWMLNNGWPSIMWHLYDYYLQPAAGYFGTKKACEPLHIQYSYDDRSVVVVNGLLRDVPHLTAEATLYDFELHPLFTHQARLTSTADSVQKIVTLPEPPAGADVTFVRLTLTDDADRVVSTNFYWLPRELSTFDWSHEQAKQHPYYTAVRNYENLTQLNRLPTVRLTATATPLLPPEGSRVSVVVHNPTSFLAFQIHLALVDQARGDEVLPVLWDDNYFSLLPGESRTVVARYDSPATAACATTLDVNGWNIEPQTRPAREAATPGLDRKPGDR
jgi:exo-1,4-beta-D-glucosaminidase